MKGSRPKLTPTWRNRRRPATTYSRSALRAWTVRPPSLNWVICRLTPASKMNDKESRAE
ncbi:hypothetical protein EVA_13612 [gut metagenome]|uniref:Uncharacterized protein n=1 Tax=gut metagenome TaxID=749906 RepID=J9FUV4_9ZZZZ